MSGGSGGLRERGHRSKGDGWLLEVQRNDRVGEEAHGSGRGGGSVALRGEGGPGDDLDGLLENAGEGEVRLREIRRRDCQQAAARSISNLVAVTDSSSTMQMASAS